MKFFSILLMLAGLGCLIAAAGLGLVWFVANAAQLGALKLLAVGLLLVIAAYALEDLCDF